MLFPVSLALLLGSAVFVDAMPARRQSPARVYTSCTVPNTAALTFDDGPASFTSEVANTLATYNAKGTFFFNGKNFGCIYDANNAQHVKDAYNGGHQIASHTWSHFDLTKLSSDEINTEMEKMEQAFQRIVGVTPAFMRPPFGSYNDLVLEVAGSRGQSVVIWDFDSGDSSGRSAADSEAAYAARASQKLNSILALNHDVYETTAKEVLPAAIKSLQGAGYKLVTVAECLGLPAYSNVGSPQSGSFSC